MTMEVTQKSAEDTGDKVSLLGKRLETDFKGKREVLLLRFGSQRKPFQLKHLTNQTHRIGNSRLWSRAPGGLGLTDLSSLACSTLDTSLTSLAWIKRGLMPFPRGFLSAI